MRRLFYVAVAVVCGHAAVLAARYIHDQWVEKEYMGGSERASTEEHAKAHAKEVCFSKAVKQNDVGAYRLLINAARQDKAIVIARGKGKVVALDLAVRGNRKTFVSQEGWFRDLLGHSDLTNRELWAVADACGRRIDAASVVKAEDGQGLRLEEKNRQVLDYAERLLDAHLPRKNIGLFVPAHDPAAVGVIYEGRYVGRIDFARSVADFYGTDAPLADGQTAMSAAQAVAYAQAKVIMDKLSFGGKINLEKSFADLQRKWDDMVRFNQARQIDPSAGILANCMRTTVENAGPYYQSIYWATGLQNENLLRVALVYKTPTALDRLFPENKTEQASIWVGFDNKHNYRIELESITRGARGDNWGFTNLRHGVVVMSEAKDNKDNIERDYEASRRLLSRLDGCVVRYVDALKPAPSQ